MSLIAKYADGQFQTGTASSTSLSNAKDKNTSGIDSEAFLNLLVAEMQNQDPLEPTSNTEWVSQYATFTQVSEIQEIGKDMSNIKAQDLVGQDVIMKVTNAAGNTDYVAGKVDYVVYEEGEAYLSIKDSLYSVVDLDTVASPDYMAAYNMASEVAKEMEDLPPVEEVTSANEKAIRKIKETTDNMDSYQKTFLQESVYEKIDEYYNKLLSVLENSSETEEEEG